MRRKRKQRKKQMQSKKEVCTDFFVFYKAESKAESMLTEKRHNLVNSTIIRMVHRHNHDRRIPWAS